MTDKRDYERLKKTIRSLSEAVVRRYDISETVHSLMKPLTPLEIHDMEKELAEEGVYLEEIFPGWEERLVKMIEVKKMEVCKMSMFCFQCSETMNGKGCALKGICGKESDVAALQDLLVWVLKGVSYWGVKAKGLGVKTTEEDIFVAEGLFTTITNVNFDKEDIANMIKQALSVRDGLREKVAGKLGKAAYDSKVPEAASWKTDGGIEAMELKGHEVGVLLTENEDVRSLRELMTYGVKGIAAYADHAWVLKKSDSEVFDFLQEALAATLDDSLTVDELIANVMKTGETAVKVMQLLDEANTSTFGNPEITEVYTGTKAGPGILVSGHDLLDLEELLKQTAGTGINIYTHGEMLPAHGYPELKKYDHLVGNFGTSWFNQQKEFNQFNGAIVMTTNCIQKPLDTYKDRIFTTGLVGWPGVAHIPNRTARGTKDFSAVIAKAKALGSLEVIEGKKIPVGFAHAQVGQLAGKIVDAVKSGAIRRFVVMAGCDGHAPTREYYTDVAKALPKDTVILTAGCAKYRYNMLDLGDIGGIPRVIDAGQCNDSYSLVVTALALKDAFGLDDINDLPISYDIAWYEQKAVTVLLALLFLGVKGIRLGPVLPAFVSPNVLKVLIDKFDIKGIDTVKSDIDAMMAGK
jgi:hydroxylamine reductase